MKQQKNFKLTATQLNYLHWFNEGDGEQNNVILICVDIREKFGHTVHSSPPPFKTDFRAIRKLYKKGLVEVNQVYDISLAWLVVTISPKGQTLLEVYHD